jgi:DNA excision repair protein ERCC-3
MDTEEMFYSSKRQQFLVDQGYAFKVITGITDYSNQSELMLSTEKEQLALLKEVKQVNEDSILEEMNDDPDDIIEKEKSQVVRTVKKLNAVSGEDGSKFMEVKGGAQPLKVNR